MSQSSNNKKVNYKKKYMSTDFVYFWDYSFNRKKSTTLIMLGIWGDQDKYMDIVEFFKGFFKTM